MSRASITIRNSHDRSRAALWVAKAPFGTRVDFKAGRRSLDQNAKMWAMLSDVARQVEHCGRKYTPEQWKVLFMHACGREVAFLPSLDKSTFIPWGQSSSNLSKAEMSELLEFMSAWGAQNGVQFHDEMKVEPYAA